MISLRTGMIRRRLALAITDVLATLLDGVCAHGAAYLGLTTSELPSVLGWFSIKGEAARGVREIEAHLHTAH
jgi:hypothetical protein